MAIAAVSLASTTNVAAAQAWCRSYARSHDENFTVVSWLLPRELRPHFYAVYSFCRWTDDLGDEAEGDRLLLLDGWERDLRACFDGIRTQPLFIALGATIDRYEIPPEPFLRLIEANRMDQRKTHFETFDELYHYCQYSATPVGQMVLHVLGYHDAERLALADSVCIGLQLANFLQDVARDYDSGRCYLPAEDLRRFGVTEESIAQRKAGGPFRELMAFEVARARDFFQRGEPLESLVDRRTRLDVRLFRLGGEAILTAIDRANYDVLTCRPVIRRRTKARMALINGVRLKLGF